MTEGHYPAGQPLPIGVFDSGVGGLTVLRAIRERLPGESCIYLGDTARLPYGTKSRETIIRYSVQAATFLVRQGVKCLVVACNTASSVALEALRERFAPLPVLGVVAPGAAAGCRASVSGRIAVIATESTIREGAYEREIRRLRPDAEVVGVACPLFVALAEEGWTEGPVVEAVAHRYLDGMLETTRPDTLVLGCTHFPVLAPALRRVLGPGVRLVDSAATTAAVLAEALAHGTLLESRGGTGSLTLFATDSPERFARVGGVFLGSPIGEGGVQLVDLGAAGSGVPAPFGN